MVLAAVGQLYAGLAASALAALDDYRSAAFGFAVGSIAGLGFILLRVEPDGIVALSWGMALNGAIALLVPALALAVRARREGCPAAPPVRAARRPRRASPSWVAAWRCRSRCRRSTWSRSRSRRARASGR